MAFPACLRAFFLGGLLVLPVAAVATAEPPPGGTPAAEVAAPLPPARSIRQSARIGGRLLQYQATAGSTPVHDADGKAIADVTWLAYAVPGVERPVTFALNGGPGAASVYLNLGSLGPRRVQFGDRGDSPSAPPIPEDNPGSWLDFTDLVFIDPVGTGFSRARIPADEAAKAFYTTEKDIEYLAGVIYDWLVEHGRLRSAKYLVGESYGGFRVPRLAHRLQTRLGVAMNGLVLVSPLLEPAASRAGDLSPLPWMLTLPTIAAAHLERQGRLSDAAMEEVIAYARGDYVQDLLRGPRDAAAQARIVERVTALTGLPADFVRRSGGRLETQAFLREVFREEGRLGSRYDANVTAFDPFPFAPTQRTNDPILDGIIAPTTSAIVDFVTREIGWKPGGRYHALSYEVNRAWDRKDTERGAVGELRQALAIDPRLKVLIVHGWGDLSTPYMASRLVVDQLPAMGDPARVQLKAYPGGHMFYSRGDSQAAFRSDVMALYGAH